MAPAKHISKYIRDKVQLNINTNLRLTSILHSALTELRMGHKQTSY